jgi:formyl-CoA transferase
MGKALEGVKILDFTHVQSGPTCTQLLAWFGADVIKVERPGVGDITRGQLQDVPNADSLYFTMLNHNKRSITIDSKNKKGMDILERLVKKCDVLVENFAPGALDRMGLTWERIQQLNPRMIYASVKGFGPGPYEDCKVYENVAQCTGGSASTTGREGPRSSPARRSAPAPACTWRSALSPPLSPHPFGQRPASPAPCRTACSTWRVKMRDQQRSRTAP